jgi:hypothetical protein
VKFKQLIDIISETHSTLQQKAASAVNKSLTIRNWLIGFYIVEFEQNGEDRAKYGDRLLESIAEKTKHIKGLSSRNLNLFRQFYIIYPQIMQTVSAQSKMIPDRELIGVNPGELLNRLAFSQFVKLIRLERQPGTGKISPHSHIPQ